MARSLPDAPAISSESTVSVGMRFQSGAAALGRRKVLQVPSSFLDSLEFLGDGFRV